MKVLRPFVLGFVSMAACSTSGPDEPLPLTVSMQLTGDFDFPDAPVRIAALWTVAEPPEDEDEDPEPSFVVLADIALNSTTSIAQLGLRLPSTTTIADSYFVETLNLDSPILRLPAASVAVHRPRILAYADMDRNARFNPDVLGTQGPDRVLGFGDNNGAGIAAVLDIERSLSGLVDDQTDQYYFGTGGRYSAFVHVSTQNPLRIRLPGLLRIGAMDPDLSRTDLACSRRWGFSNTPARNLSVIADPPIDTTQACGALATDCTSAILSDVTPPELPDTEDDNYFVQCRQNERFDLLITYDQGFTCRECDCQPREDVVAYVTTATRTPDWWPCGDVVPYCNTSRPLVERDPSCDPED